NNALVSEVEMGRFSFGTTALNTKVLGGIAVAGGNSVVDVLRLTDIHFPSLLDAVKLPSGETTTDIALFDSTRIVASKLRKWRLVDQCKSPTGNTAKAGLDFIALPIANVAEVSPAPGSEGVPIETAVSWRFTEPVYCVDPDGLLPAELVPSEDL